jgi:hypothetical protein
MASAKSMYPVKSMAPETSFAFFKLTIGASGAVTSFNGYGIYSVTRDSAGTYSIVFNQQHAYLMYANFCQLYASGEDITVQMISEDVDNPTLASRKIVIELKAAATATDATSGSLLYGYFAFCDSKTLGFGPTT